LNEGRGRRMRRRGTKHTEGFADPSTNRSWTRAGEIEAKGMAPLQPHLQEDCRDQGQGRRWRWFAPGQRPCARGCGRAEQHEFFTTANLFRALWGGRRASTIRSTTRRNLMQGGIAVARTANTTTGAERRRIEESAHGVRRRTWRRCLKLGCDF